LRNPKQNRSESETFFSAIFIRKTIFFVCFCKFLDKYTVKFVISHWGKYGRKQYF
jgi:sugar phosphate permease